MLPNELNFEAVPDQTPYKVSLHDTDYFEIPGGLSHPLVFTSDLATFLFEGDPGGGFDWHTHNPEIDQQYLCLKGSCRFTLEQPDGSHQTVELESGELLYLPGGARHKMEIIGDERHEGIDINRHTASGRLEMLLPEFETFDKKEWPIALWIDKLRNEVIQKNEKAVSP